MVQKGGKSYHIKHAQILLKLEQKAENETWTYDRIKDVYGASHSTIAGVADVFMISEPLAGKRGTFVTQTRTALDFAEILKYTSNTLYPRAELKDCQQQMDDIPGINQAFFP